MKKILAFLFLLSSLSSAQVSRNFGVTAPSLLTKYGITYGLNGRFTLGSTSANTTTTKKYLTETGTGSLGQAPVFSTLDLGALTTASNGIALSGISNTSGLGVNIGISLNGIALDRIAVAAANSKLLGSGAAGAGSTYSELSLGTGLSMSGTTLNSTPGMTNPMTTLGDIIYEDNTFTPVRLAGNISVTQKVLAQTGTGVISAPPSWIDPTTVIPADAVILDPSTDTRNVIVPSLDKVALTITGGATSDVLRIKDNSANLHAVFNSNGFLQLGDNGSDLGASAHLKVYQLAGSIGMILRGTSGADLLQWKSGTTIYGSIDPDGYAFIGDNTNKPSTIGSLNVIQKNNTTPAVVIKEASPAGFTMLRMVTHGDVTMLEADATGLSIGGATPAARLDVRPGTLGVAAVIVNTASTVKTTLYQNSVSVAGGAATLIHSFTTATGTVIKFRCHVVARVTAGIGVIGNGVSFDIAFTYKNIAGVLTQIGADAITNKQSDDAAYTAASNINGTAVELKVTGKAAHTLTWAVDEYVSPI